MTADTVQRPYFSLVSAVYAAEEYLPEFLDSIHRQEYGLDDVELIFVIDGSPDDSEGVIRQWLDLHGHRGTVIVQENAGPGAARNAGLAVAQGEWVSFPDPDDVLDPSYLSRVRAFADTEGVGLDFISARVIKFSGPVDAATDTHPLGFKFRRGTRIGSPENDPKLIHLQIASAFLRRSAIADRSNLFDPRIRPVFEDAHAIANFWLHAGASRIGILADAFYYYRQRSDGSSLIQSALTSHTRYTDVLKYAHLPLLERASKDGPAPRWLQYMVIYDLLWPFVADHRGGSPTSGLPDAVKEEFLNLFQRVLAFIDAATLFEFNIVAIPMQVRVAWHVLKTGTLPEGLEVWVSRVDDREHLAQLRYFSTSPTPDDRLELDGTASDAVFSKSRAVEYFGRTFMYERILWVPAMQDIRIVMANGRPSRLRYTLQGEPAYEAPVGRIWRDKKVPAAVSAARFAGRDEIVPVVPWRSQPLRRAFLALKWRVAVARDRYTRRLGARTAARTSARFKQALSSPRLRARFSDAWILMDRDTMAGDNAESLYRYLRAAQPHVNAWFVIRKSAPDYRRLRREGFRLVDFGSLEHAVLMRLASHLVSSHADHYVLHPVDERKYGRGSWKYTFLQHGVTTNDLSRWLNSKPIDLFLAATTDEYHSLVDDDTQYMVTAREVALTGFPRHDDLTRAARPVPQSDRDVLLIVPTWRKYLLTEPTGTGNARDLAEGFWETDFARHWFGLLRDERLHAIAREYGLRIVFAPHPQLQQHIRPEHLPSGVEFFSYADGDIKAMIARSRIALTDYSSLGTEAVFAKAPLVYFQFDRAEVFGGTHVYRPGYFTAERDGYGPVAYDGDAVIEGVARLLGDSEYAERYADRIERAYRYRDDRNSERAFLAIQSLDVPWHERDRSLFDGSTTEYDLPAPPVPAETTPADAVADDGSSDGVSDPQGDLVTSDVAVPSDRPVITAISAVYNVAEYLPAYLASLDAQGAASDRVEVLLVSDGSPDVSEQLIEAWLTTTSVRARLLRKENGGAGSARNFGLDHATGDWVSFPDPDDVLAPGYFGHLLDAAEQADRDDAHLIAAKVLQFGDDPARAVDNHLLGYRYRGKRRVVELEEHPTYFHAHVSSGLYRRAIVEEHGIRFDPRLRVAFDDATFAAEYTLTLDRPRMLVAPEARYLYRRRVDGSSLVGTMWSKPAKYTEVPRYGYLRLLESRPVAPLWLQSLVMYDMEWFFREYLNPDSPNRRIDADTSAQFLSLLDAILERFDVDMLAAFPLHPIESEVRVALAVRKTGVLPWNEGTVRMAGDGRTATVTFFAASADDAVTVTQDARPVEPTRERRRPIEFYGEVFCERVTLEVPTDASSVIRCGGTIVPLTLRAPGGGRGLGPALSPWRLREALDAERPVSARAHLKAGLPAPVRRAARPAVDVARSLRGLLRRGRAGV